MADYKNEEEVHKTDIDDVVNKVSPRLLMLIAGGALMVALFAMISMLMMVSLSSDMTSLEDQIRKAGKTAKAMQEEMAQLRTLLAPAVAARQAEGAQHQSNTGLHAPHPSSQNPSADKQVRVETGATTRDCNVKSGDASGLANCLKLAPLS
jgi:hypothetical protein